MRCEVNGSFLRAFFCADMMLVIPQGLGRHIQALGPNAEDELWLGWFIGEASGRPVRYGWGYGGQMIYVIPERALTIAMLSATDQPAGRSGYRDELHALAAGIAAALA